MNRIYIEYNKGQNDRPYLALRADLGYKVITITFDKPIIYELSPVPISELYALPFGGKVDIL